MARAYKKTYLNGAMRNLAVMMDCGVRKYGYTIGEFYQKFLSSCVSRQFSQGNPRYLVGMSGAELADLVVQESGGSISDKNDGTYTTGPEYWAGWVLAYYQWLSRRSFAFMQRKGLGADTVVSMYRYSRKHVSSSSRGRPLQVCRCGQWHYKTIIHLTSIMSIISDAIQSKCLAFSDRIIKLNDYLLAQAANKKPFSMAHHCGNFPIEREQSELASLCRV